ncbi:MAG TPA: GAF domain-containing sensor histidine kinase [Chloroflexia bacterium]|nr:GAF domain-containing sensor histidine kinase [Chloroflexia bacterium]
MTSFATGEFVTSALCEAQLAVFLRALPACETVEDTLRLTLKHAEVLTGARASVALVGNPPLTVPANAPADLIADAQRAWLAVGGESDGPPGPLLPPAPGAAGAAAPTAARVRPTTAGDQLYLPLQTVGKLDGLLVLRGAAPFGPDVAGALRAIAEAAGRLVQLQGNLRHDQLRLAELGMLYEVATAMSSTLDLPELLKLIVERTQTALRSEACTLMLLDESTEELVFEIPTGEAGSALQQLRVPLSQGICGWVARNAQPAIVNDLQADPRFDTHVDQSSGFQTRTALCVPLLVRGRVSGVLEVLNKLDEASYTEDDLGLLTTLAGQAAVALENAQLFTSVQAEHERFLAVEDQVRKELARDLHDGPAQRLAAICMEVDILRRLLTSDPSRLPAELDSLEALARKANREVRTLQFQLRPVMLETRGLRAAIEYYINQLRETEAIVFTLDVQGCKGRLPANVEQAAFGIVQEALGNIRKHAGARQTTIQMREAGDRWVITIMDDGRGFDVAATLRSYETRGSLGLLNMRERGQQAGGTLDLASVPGQGTTVTLAIPTRGYIPSEEPPTSAFELSPAGRQ